MSPDNDDPLIPLVIELVMSATGDDFDEAYVASVHRRLDEALTSQEDAYDLITALVAFAGTTISEWAEATDRNPDEIMQAIGLDVAQSMYADEGD